MPDPPEIGQRTMVPEQPPVTHLVQLRNAHAVRIGRHLFSKYVHCNLTEIHVGAYTRRGGDASLPQHITNHCHGQFMGGLVVKRQIIGHIHKDLIYGIDVDILRCDVFQVDFIYFRAAPNVVRHARHCCQEIDLPVRMRLQLGVRN